MEKRRRHGECKEGKAGCEVILGRTCVGPKKVKAIAVFEDGRRAVRELWKTMRFEGGFATFAAVALVMSFAVNLWLFAEMGSNMVQSMGMEGANRKLG